MIPSDYIRLGGLKMYSFKKSAKVSKYLTNCLLAQLLRFCSIFLVFCTMIRNIHIAHFLFSSQKVLNFDIISRHFNSLLKV